MKKKCRIQNAECRMVVSMPRSGVACPAVPFQHPLAIHLRTISSCATHPRTIHLHTHTRYTHYLGLFSSLSPRMVMVRL
jgi:hypothetical protein